MEEAARRERTARSQIQGAFIAILLLLTQTGCYSHIQSLEGYLPEDEVKNYPTVDALRKARYTDKAYTAIKNIPVVDGFTPSGYAAGTSVWSSIYSFLTGTGLGRKIVFDKDNLNKQGYVGIIHEDIHHFDDMDRDDEADWINHGVFFKAYEMLSKDQQFKGIQLWCESRANDWIPNTFGVGYGAEHIAYIGMFLTNKDKKLVPDYLKAVFSKILKLEYKLVSIYKTTDGKIYKVNASPNQILLEQLK